jgi:catechol 2,3-dioxygenase-like lactoylglutathione lyase family enzyme
MGRFRPKPSGKLLNLLESCASLGSANLQLTSISPEYMGSGRSIDHVVVAVRDLDQATQRYQALGFTLTPRAMHDERMGTSNRLAQFAAKNFIELLEVDRPDTLMRHDFAASPPLFSFGDHNRMAVKDHEGASMLVFATDDAEADTARFAAAGLPTFAPFSFERRATLPDGAQVTLAFSLAFVRSPQMPRVGFFACENRSQQYFWKPAYQSHANGATGITAAYLSSPDPKRDAMFVGKMFNGDVRATSGGYVVACGPSQELRVLVPQAVAERDTSLAACATQTAFLAGISIAGPGKHEFTPAAQAHGVFIEWIAT